MTKYCCARFGEAIENAGKNGLSVIAQADINNKPFFIMIFRSLDNDDQKEYAEIVGKTGYKKKVCLATELSIQYCPWCGKNLQRFYRKDWVNMVGERLELPLPPSATTRESP